MHNLAVFEAKVFAKKYIKFNQIKVINVSVINKMGYCVKCCTYDNNSYVLAKSSECSFCMFISLITQD